MLHTWWRPRTGRPSHAAARRQHAPLHLESLERRHLLSFFPPVAYATGPFPSTPVAAEFVTGSGVLDLAVTDTVVHKVSVLPGNGDGTFGDPVDYAVPDGPIGVAAADFTLDGHLDLLLVHSVAAVVSVLPGNGDGTFGEPILSSAVERVNRKVVGDFNQDGLLDVALSSSTQHLMLVLLGNGDGTFAEPVSYPAGNFPINIAGDDFDLDGDLDLAVTNRDSNDVTVFLNHGDGTFADAISYLTAGDFSLGGAVGDLNGDGAVDFVTGSLRNHLVSVLFGRGDGTFGDLTVLSAGLGPSTPVLADYNLDGLLDLAITNQLSNDVSLLLGRGDGTFDDPVHYSTGSTLPLRLIAADLSGDGYPDLVAAHFRETIAVFINVGAGSSPGPVAGPVLPPWWPVSVTPTLFPMLAEPPQRHAAARDSGEPSPSLESARTDVPRAPKPPARPIKVPGTFSRKADTL